MSAIKVQTESGLVRTLYGREPGEQPPPVRRDSFGFALALAALASLCALLAVCSGCTTLSSEARAELETAASVAQGDVRDWPSLTDAQRFRLHWKLARALASIRADATGEPVPEVFLLDPWAAPITSRSTGQ